MGSWTYDDRLRGFHEVEYSNKRKEVAQYERKGMERAGRTGIHAK